MSKALQNTKPAHKYEIVFIISIQIEVHHVFSWLSDPLIEAIKKNAFWKT